MTMDDGADDEDRLLQSVAEQNAHSIFLARQRAEQELMRTKEALELKTKQLADALALSQASLEERDRARAEAEAATAAAQAANDAKSRFLGMISHELRTPLGAIGGYVDLMAVGIHGELSEGHREFISRIRHNQRHMLGLVDQLLDLARIEAGRIDLHLAPVPVRGVIESVRRMIEPQVEERGLRLEVESADASLRFHADQERVEQIVLNLLSNAVKFTHGGSSIRIATAAGRDEVSLLVRDRGIGIAPEELESVFEPFVQAASPVTDPRGGTGLGLTISRHLARAMGGNLSVESALGEGSTFTLTLPRVIAGAA